MPTRLLVIIGVKVSTRRQLECQRANYLGNTHLRLEVPPVRTDIHELLRIVLPERNRHREAHTDWEPTFFKNPETTSFDKNGNQSTVDGTSELPGNYVLSGYYANFKFAELNGSNIQHNACGIYGMGQQMIWRNAADPNTNFSLWGGLTFSPQQDISLLPFMGFAGTIWQGFVPERDRDQLLLTYLVSDFSRDYADSIVALGGKRPTTEHVLEAGYAIYITNYYTIQPDIQYVIRPNGAGEVRDSLVIGIQFVASF